MKILNKLIKYEILSYILFGILTTIVDWIVYYILSSLGMPYLINTIISWVVAVLFAFITNKIFVFGSKSFEKVFNELFLFVVARLSSLLINILGMYVFIGFLSANQYIAKAILSILVILLNYIFSKIFIFKNK